LKPKVCRSDSEKVDVEEERKGDAGANLAKGRKRFKEMSPLHSIIGREREVPEQGSIRHEEVKEIRR